MKTSLQPQFQRCSNQAMAIGLAAAVICVAGVAFNPPQFFRSWLVAWLFFAGLSFGALIIFMMQSLTGGAWGEAIRPLCEAAMSVLPLVGALFLPIILGAHYLFPWSRNDVAANHPEWAHKHGYLNLPFFTIRAGFYFVSLGALALQLCRLSAQGGGSENAPRAVKWIPRLSGGGLVFYVLCMNFASTDWVMSLEPDWYSTIFVVIFMAGQFVSALALMTVLLAAIANREPFAGAITQKHFHDLGNLLLAFIIFWTYVSFSQYLITWSGNLPREIGWYLHRSTHGWRVIVGILAAIGFAAPVALLLLRSSKQKSERLAVIAAVVLLANLLNVYWFVMPTFHPEGVRVHWLDFATLIAMGGLWTGMFLRVPKGRLLAPQRNRKGS